jgi:hypothetical protein
MNSVIKYKEMLYCVVLIVASPSTIPSRHHQKKRKKHVVASPMVVGPPPQGLKICIVSHYSYNQSHFLYSDLLNFSVRMNLYYPKITNVF